MTPDELARLRALAEAATPGPWHMYATARVGSLDIDDIAVCSDAAITETGKDLDTKQAERNAAYIAKADPDTTLALLDRIAELETLTAQCKATLEAMHPAAGMPDSSVASLYNAMMEKLRDD